MIKYILILIVLYLTFSLDPSCFKSFEYSCLVSMKDRLVGLVDIVVNFIDHTLIPTIDHINDHIRSIAKGPKSKQGSGGMISKIDAADYAMKQGVTVTIANGRQPQVLQDILENKSIGTTFKKTNQ